MHLLPAAFLGLAQEHVLLDPAARMAIATDGEAVALLPLPAGFDRRALVPIHDPTQDTNIWSTSGDATEVEYNLSALRTEGAYVVALNPAKLAALAAALGAGDLVIIEFPAHPAEGPMFVRPGTGDAYGYLMPQAMPDNGPEGLLQNPQSDDRQSSIKPPQADLPPPIVTASAERHTLEIAFGGKPADEIREALKDPALGFRYSGRGTKRGVPPSMWYGPDNPFSREKIQALLGVEIQPAKAA